MSHAVHTSSIHYRESVRKHNDLVMSPAGRGGAARKGSSAVAAAVAAAAVMVMVTEVAVAVRW